MSHLAGVTLLIFMVECTPSARTAQVKATMKQFLYEHQEGLIKKHL